MDGWVHGTKGHKNKTRCTNSTFDSNWLRHERPREWKLYKHRGPKHKMSKQKREMEFCQLFFRLINNATIFNWATVESDRLKLKLVIRIRTRNEIEFPLTSHAKRDSQSMKNLPQRKELISSGMCSETSEFTYISRQTER